MSKNYFKSLLFRSGKIQKEIEKEQKKRFPDWMKLFKLKRIRLHIQDRLYKIALEHNMRRKKLA